MAATYWPAFRTADGITWVYGADFDSQDAAFSAGRALGCMIARDGEHVAVLLATRDQVGVITAGIRKRTKLSPLLDPARRGAVECTYCTNPAVRHAVVRPCRHAATLCLLHAAEVQAFLAQTAQKLTCSRCGERALSVDLRPL